MDDNLHNVNDLLSQIEGKAVRTAQGSFVRLEDVKELIQRRSDATAVEQAEAPKPKNVFQARAQASAFLKKTGFGPQRPLEPAKAVPATDPQPPSRA